jgi:hypothetical protein
MRGTMWLVSLGCAILVSSSGCCGFLRDGGCGRGCGYDSCADCGPTCGPIGHPLRQRACADDGDDCSTSGRCATCGSCGDDCGGCCQRNFCFHPLRWIGRLFYCGTWCGPSCDGTYWGEAVSDPPDCCEPCTRGAHWTGRTGCANCNHGATHESGGETPMLGGQSVEDDGAMEPVPTPAAKAPTKATRRAPPANYDR